MTASRAIVYGGSGFLGSHVADALTAAGYKVRIFDREPSPFLLPEQEMVTGDIRDLNSVVDAAKDCDYVYNYAAIADINDAINRPVDTAVINVLGNVHALEAALHNKVKRFVFASSVYVYSKSGSFYRASKQASEQFIETYHENYGLNYTILRYGTLFGRRADERNGIYRLLKQALEKKSLNYKGDPNEMREYIHVADAAKLSVQILAPEYENRHMILTGSERMSVVNLMRMIAEICPGNVEFSFEESAPTRGHYVITPYSFNPRIGHKLIATDQIDIGQGLLDCVSEYYEKLIDPTSQSAPLIEKPGEWQS